MGDPSSHHPSDSTPFSEPSPEPSPKPSSQGPDPSPHSHPDPHSTPPSAHPAPTHKPYKDTTKRDRLLSLLLAAGVMFFLVFAVMEMSKGYRGVTGTIIEKRFIAAPETQITVGRAGLSRREIAGDFYFIVRVPQDDRNYTIKVDQLVYQAKEEGDPFYFVRPPRRSEPILPDKSAEESEPVPREAVSS